MASNSTITADFIITLSLECCHRCCFANTSSSADASYHTESRSLSSGSNNGYQASAYLAFKEVRYCKAPSCNPKNSFKAGFSTSTGSFCQDQTETARNRLNQTVLFCISSQSHYSNHDYPANPSASAIPFERPTSTSTSQPNLPHRPLLVFLYPPTQHRSPSMACPPYPRLWRIHDLALHRNAVFYSE